MQNLSEARQSDTSFHVLQWLSEARTKLALKGFANRYSRKSLDRQRVSGRWFCAEHGALLHHMLRSDGEKCWLRIKYHHYLYRAPHSGAPFLSFFPFVLPSPSPQTPSSKQVSARVTHYSPLKGDENCQQVKPRIVRRQTAGKDVPPVIQGTTVQLAVKEQEILAELIRH